MKEYVGGSRRSSRPCCFCSPKEKHFLAVSDGPGPRIPRQTRWSATAAKVNGTFAPANILREFRQHVRPSNETFSSASKFNCPDCFEHRIIRNEYFIIMPVWTTCGCTYLSIKRLWANASALSNSSDHVWNKQL